MVIVYKEGVYDSYAIVDGELNAVQKLIKKARDKYGHDSEKLEEMLNEYGYEIEWHRDDKHPIVVW